MKRFRTIVLSVLGTLLVVAIGLGVLGTVYPSQPATIIVKTTTAKPAT